MPRRFFSAVAMTSLLIIGCSSDPGSVENEEGVNSQEEMTQEIEQSGMSEQDYLNSQSGNDGASQ